MSTLAPPLGEAEVLRALRSLTAPPSPPPRHLPCRERKLQARRGLLRVRAFFNAPVVIFHLNVLSYFVFLCLFAYVLMVDFRPTPSWCEYLIYVWLFSLVCEELRQVRPPAPFPLPHIPNPRGLSSGPCRHLGAPGPGTRSRVTFMGGLTVGSPSTQTPLPGPGVASEFLGGRCRGRCGKQVRGSAIPLPSPRLSSGCTAS